MAGVSLKKRAYEELQSRILSGVYAPGDLLNRRGVAADLGMSVAPVHEAMIQLERDGFLEALPRHGTRVRSGSRADVYGHLVVREALECQAARMICGAPLQRRMAELLPLADLADAALEALLRRAEHEVTFHLALVETADCPALLREYRRVMQLGLFFRINLLMALPAREPASRHRHLLETLAAATPAQAEECMRAHVWSGKPDVFDPKNQNEGRQP